MEKINCPICNQDNTEIIFKKGNLNKDLINVICKSCALVYISPRLTKQEYDKFHEKEFLSEKSITSVEQVKQKLNDSDFKIKSSIFNFLDEYLEEGQNVLDIGCGFGVLLDIIKKEKKANVFGIELGDVDVGAAKEYYGLDLFHGSLEDFSKNHENHGKFDVIIAHHTFEHLPKPLDSLEQIKKLLKPEGVLYVAVPNTMNIKKRPEIFFQIAHPFSYSPHSLKLILEKAGFGVIKFNRNAGYPGGMEMAAQTGRPSMDDAGFNEGKDYKKVMQYVKQLKNKFSGLRGLRDIFLFFMPKFLRIRFGNVVHQILKKGFSDKQFFNFIVLPSSIVAGFLFILRHILVFISVAISGRIYNLFSFINIDPLFYYAPFVRAVYDGSYNVVDGRILENFFLPNLWTQLSPILIAPLLYLTGSISFAFVLGHFLMAVGAFVCFYLLCFYIIKNRIFSLLYSFVFITVPLVFNYLFPTSLENLKLVGRVVLPFGSPPGEALLSKYISFSVLPGFLFFVSAFLFIFLALTKKRKLFIVLAGLNLGILTYIAITLFLYTGAALFIMLILFL
ncbi:class I SAM-dependent methyltransferase, partial [Patescibacteria group bacterium]|nr:class I SAM-dependent methyltransferase [Patescibacteria group bacterium]